MKTIEKEREAVKGNVDRLKYQIRSLENNLQSLSQQKIDKLRAFGKDMPDVIRTIRQFEKEGRWRGRMPIGPFGVLQLLIDRIGMHIKVLDKKFNKVIETVLGHTLSGLGVETHEDLKLLQQILDRYRM